jgi:OmpA-OmpF porin, OOP family
MMSRALSSGLVAAALVLAPNLAAAQAEDGANIDVNAFKPAMDSRGFITVNSAHVLGHKELSFGLVSTWRRNPVLFEREGCVGAELCDFRVGHVLTPTLIGAAGLRAGPLAFQVGASLPFVVVDGGRTPSYQGDPNNANDTHSFGIEGQGVGDIGLHAKIRLVNNLRAPRIGVGVVGSVYLPTSSREDRWLGDKALTPQAMLVVDKENRSRRLRLGLNVGIRAPTDTVEYVDQGPPPFMETPGFPAPDIATGGRIANGASIPFGTAIAYALSLQKLDLVGEVYGAIPLDGENYFPLEAIAGIKVYLARNSYLQLGGGVGTLDVSDARFDARAFIGIVFEPRVTDRDGDGIPDHLDACPDEPGVPEFDGCPPPLPDPIPDEIEEDAGYPDRDGDGIPDHLDACPDEPGIPELDGCPESDRDGDGILDHEDMCPDEPGIPELAGCPDRGRVVVTDTHIEILDKIHFEFDSDVIKGESFGILDTIAGTLAGNPDIQLIEIQGHTDQRGSASYNLNLSDRRAASVRRYLVDKGIDPRRLTSKGYGKSQLLDERNNEDAYAKNRRVEFLILKRGP